MAKPFRLDRTWVFPVTPEAFFETISRLDEFPRWWSWLRRCETSPPRRLGAGASARCVVQSPVPYPLRFTVTIDELRPGTRVRTTVSGDLAGPARLEVAPHPAGCSARLTWSLEPHAPLLRNLARVARPVMVAAHDWVVVMGVAQFERHALGDRLRAGS